MGRPMIRIQDVLEQIYRDENWVNDDTVTLTKAKFQTYLIWEKEITTNVRKVNELWGLLLTAPFVKAINQYSVLVNIRDMLSVLSKHPGKSQLLTIYCTYHNSLDHPNVHIGEEA